jgi:hypothetical protein
MLRKKIARRRCALRWFADEEIDPATVLLRKRPSTRLCRQMQREELLDVEPVGQFGFSRWRLSSLGRFLVQSHADA